MATPTDYNTVYTTMLRIQEVGNELGFDHIPLFFDMGLLTKALEIQWANPDLLSKLILCDGGMHLIMSLFSGIAFMKMLGQRISSLIQMCLQLELFSK